MEGHDGAEAEAQPSGKRQRRGDAQQQLLPPEDGEFPRGAIKRVKVHDFMTYSGTVAIQPGPRLNLVLGPNGTGKSSLVCALCIGLGGRPQLLGRADNLKDYIRRGCSEAWTEITLSGGASARDTVVRRNIREAVRDDGSHGYSSKWRLNGRDVNQSEVIDLIKGLNIQFENLCQFLPQDRVVEFARMNPFQLLEATQKAIGDSSLDERHKQLIAKSGQAKTMGTSLETLKAQLEKLETENKALERDADRFRKRQELQRKLQDVRKKEVWSGVAVRQRKLDDDQQALELAQSLLRRHQSEAADDAAPLKVARQRAKTLKEQLQRMGPAPSHQAFAAENRRRHDAVDKHTADITGIQDRIGRLQQRSDALRDAIAGLEQQLADAEAALAAMPPVVNNSAAINALNAEVSQLAQQAMELDSERDELEDRKTMLNNDVMRTKGSIAQLNSSRHRRLMDMDKSRLGVASLHAWLEEQKRTGTFTGDVHGPIGAEIKVLNAASHAAVIEAAIKGMLFDFVATNRQDEQVISAEIKRRQMTVAVHVFREPLDSSLQAMAGPASSYSRYGVTAALVDLIDAPPLIKHVLSSGNPALASAMFTTNADNIQELLRAGAQRLRTVYTREAEYRVIKASYGSDHANQSQALWDAKFLGAALSNNQEAKGQEQQRLSAAESQVKQVEQELANLYRRRGALSEQQQPKQSQLNQLHKEQAASTSRLSQAVRGIAYLKSQLTAKRAQPDPLTSKPQLEEQRAAAVRAHFKATKQLLQLVRLQWQGVLERGTLELAMKEAEMQVDVLESASSERKEQEKKLKEQVAKVQRLMASSKAALEREQRRAEEEAPMTPALKRRLDALPDDSDELEELQERLEAEVAGIVCNNPRALEEFQERQRSIDGLRRDVTRDEAALKDLTADIDDLEGAWLPELQQVVERINVAFGQAFSEIGCAGEVALDDGGGDGRDFAKYCVQIRVMFREGEALQLLTGTRQSGGERSVSTILYLLALQGVTVTPFRVVDEINQGMDPINERKVFGQLVAASTRDGTPQCFLLTPKLLPDLEYGRNVTVLQILNGAIGTAGAGGSGGGAPAWDMASLLGSQTVMAQG